MSIEQELQINIEEPINNYAEINPYEQNAKFQSVRASILTKLLTKEDKKLIANLIDQTQRVILHPEDLKTLIAAFKGIPAESVKFETRELIVVKWCKARILPFKKIVSIEPKLSETEVHILNDIYAISLDTVYDEPFKSVN